MSNTNDPSLTLLEERFLSSGYRKDLLEDRLQSERNEFHGHNLGGFVDTISGLPSKREWCSGAVYKRMRIEFDVTSAPRYAGFIENYLRAFYETVTRIRFRAASHPQQVMIFYVDLSPHDTQWLAIVSAHNAKRIEWKE